MLHIISQSPLDCAILQRIDDGDVVLFIENAVLCLIKESQYAVMLSEKMKQNGLYALAADMQVRGIACERLAPGIEIIDYAGFVELTIENARILSWC